MTRLALLIFLYFPVVSIADTEHTTKSSLYEHFGSGKAGPSIKKDRNFISLEICLDTCDYYRVSSGILQTKLWDLAFLHQYYLNDSYHLAAFRLKYGSVAKNLLNSYSKDCEDKGEKQIAHCVVTRLIEQIKPYYAFVRYDEGYRCEVVSRLMDNQFQGKSTCRKY